MLIKQGLVVRGGGKNITFLSRTKLVLKQAAYLINIKSVNLFNRPEMP
jgi:hypothetical protein